MTSHHRPWPTPPAEANGRHTFWAAARVPFLLMVAVVVALAVAWFGPFNEPAYRVKLLGSSWSVETIDGHAVASITPTISFGDMAVIETGCRTIRAAWDIDTDGSSILFERETASAPPVGPACAADLALQDAALVAALDSTEFWSVDSNDGIDLHGAHDLRLRRIAP